MKTVNPYRIKKSRKNHYWNYTEEAEVIKHHWIVWLFIILFLTVGFVMAQDKTSNSESNPELPQSLPDSNKVLIADSTNHSQPSTNEIELIAQSRITLPEQYFGDKFMYNDSLINGYVFIPEFNTLKTNEEKAVFARAYLWIRQNEILARHGYVFKNDPILQSYFEKQSWYKPNPDFKAESLSIIEMQNFWKLIARQADFQPQPPDTLRKD
jgi:hypothetical protein